MQRFALLLLCAAGLAQEPTWKNDPAYLEGEDLWNRGCALLKDGKAADARALFLEASKLYEQVGARPDAGHIHGWIAKSYVLEGRAADAARHYREAAERHERIHGTKENTVVLLYLDEFASQLLEAGRAEEAATQLDENIAIHRKLHPGDTVDLLLDFELLCEALRLQRRYDDMLRAALEGEALAARLGVGDHLALLSVVGAAAESLHCLHRPAEALEHAQQASAMARRLADADPGATIRCKYHIALNACRRGYCLGLLGRTADALSAYEEALPLLRELECDRELVSALEGMVAILVRLGRPAEALPLADEAVGAARRLKDDIYMAIACNCLGFCVDALGRKEEGLRWYGDAVACYRRAYGDRPHHRTAQALGNEGLCLWDLGRREEARARCAEAVAMTRSLGEAGRPHLPHRLYQLSVCVDSAAAVKLLEEVLETPCDAHMRAAYLVDLAICQHRLGRTEQSLALVQQAVALREDLYTLSILGQAYLRLGRLDEAVTALEAALACRDEVYGRARGLGADDESVYWRELDRFVPLSAMLETQLQRGEPREALRWVEWGRARALLDLLERSRFDPLAEAERHASLRGDAEASGRIGKLRAEVAAAEADLNRLAASAAPDDALAAARRRQAAAQHDRAGTIRDYLPVARPLLPEGIERLVSGKERMLVYAVTDRFSLVLVVPPPGREIRCYPLRWRGGAPVTKADLAPVVERYRTAMLQRIVPRGVSRDPVQEQPQGQERLLFDALLPDGVWEEVRGAGRIVLLAPPELHGVSFETLVAEKGACWLDAGPEIVYAPSASVLAWCRERKERQIRAGAPHPVVAVGDPAFEVPGLARLPGTRREVESLVKVLGEGSAALLGAAATESALRELAPKGRYLHIATHCVGSVQASETGLVLAHPQAGDGDGFLRAVDLFEHWRDRLSACELVVLSACETGLTTGEEAMALPVGFMYAGAPAVIASLWRVDDESAAELFSDFYARLRESGGKDKLKSFTEARRALKKRRPEPSHWGAFVYLGDPR